MRGIQHAAVETVGDVPLGEVDGTVARVMVTDAPEDAREGASELHDFRGPEGLGVLVEPVPRVVGHQAGPTVALFLDPQRGEVEAR
jgi:hypothetical protein